VTKLTTSPNECHYTTLWNTTCVNLFITTVMQALSIMTNWQLRTNTSQQMFKMFAFRFEYTLRRFCHWLIAWSVMLCWIPDHAKIVSSGTFAECLCVWCVPLTSRKCHFHWRSDSSFVCPWCTLLTECQIIDCINVLSSTWCVRSATAWLSICCLGFSQFLRRLRKCHPFLWKLVN